MKETIVSTTEYSFDAAPSVSELIWMPIVLAAVIAGILWAAWADGFNTNIEDNEYKKVWCWVETEPRLSPLVTTAMEDGFINSHEYVSIVLEWNKYVGERRQNYEAKKLLRLEAEQK